MIKEQEHINNETVPQNKRHARFCSVQDKSSLLLFLNLAQKNLYGEKARIITESSLNYYAYSSNAKNRYVTFQIPKKDGTSRTIDAPCKGLMVIQKALSVLLESIYTPSPSTMGFVNGRSVVANAKVHLGKQYVYNIDLKNFFPSITSGRICARLQAKPYLFNKEIAGFIADICCQKSAEGKVVLPQGAPTSPIMTNIICEKLDFKLQNLAKAFHLTYSRYADDITFSGNRNVFNAEGKFCKKLRYIIEEEEHFIINENKTRLCQRGGRMEVTGVTVNDKLNTSRKYMRQIRTMIHNWETLGYDEAQKLFVEVYNKTNTKNYKSKGDHHIENVLAGKLMYLAMVKGKEDATYINLNTRFEKLVKEHFTNGSNGILPVSDILDIWENEGLDAALALLEGNFAESVEETEEQSESNNGEKQEEKSLNNQLDGEPQKMSDFLKGEEVDSVFNRKTNYKGKIYLCPGLKTKSGKRIIISARLVSEGYSFERLAKEATNNVENNIGIIRYVKNPSNTYYISHIKAFGPIGDGGRFQLI